MTFVRLPPPGARFDQKNEAQTRRIIELALQQAGHETTTTTGAARRQVIFATGSLAPGEAESSSTDFGAPGQHLLIIEASAAARVRFYASATVRDADLDRVSTTPPGAGIGVLFEGIWHSDHEKYIAPPVLLYNADSQVASTIYYTVENLSDTTQAITVTSTVISTEAGIAGLNPADDSTWDGEVANMSGAANGQALIRTGGVWLPSALPDDTIDGEDVDLSGASDGQYLKRASGIWVPATVADDTLDGESVDLTGASDGQFLKRVSGVWVPATGGGGGGDGTIPQFGANAQPGSPDTMDDEFEGSSLDGKWNQRNSPTLSYYGDQSRIVLEAPAHSGDSWQFIMQTVPSGSWKIRTKMALAAVLANYRSAGLVIAKGTTTDKFIYIGIKYVSGAIVGTTKFTNWTTYSGDAGTALSISGDVGSLQDGHILEIEYDNSTTTLYFRWAKEGNGVIMRTLFSETVATFLGSMSEIGIGVDTNDASNGSTYCVADWFRRIS